MKKLRSGANEALGGRAKTWPAPKHNVGSLSIPHTCALLSVYDGIKCITITVDHTACSIQDPSCTLKTYTSLLHIFTTHVWS